MSRDITQLHPFTQMLAKELVRRCTAQGLKIKITDCVRTEAEQNAIGASRTNAKYKYSYHNWGLAFDFCRNDGTGAYNESGNFFRKVGAIGAKLGLEWGGYWKSPVDQPHFQFDGFTQDKNDVTLMIKQYVDPKKFLKHSDYKWTNPLFALTPKSSFKNILWLQVRLNIHGIPTDMDGVWSDQTIRNVKSYWKKNTGNDCTGKKVSLKCIKMLSKDPEEVLA